MHAGLVRAPGSSSDMVSACLRRKPCRTTAGVCHCVKARVMNVCCVFATCFAWPQPTHSGVTSDSSWIMKTHADRAKLRSKTADKAKPACLCVSKLSRRLQLVTSDALQGIRMRHACMPALQRRMPAVLPRASCSGSVMASSHASSLAITSAHRHLPAKRTAAAVPHFDGMLHRRPHMRPGRRDRTVSAAAASITASPSMVISDPFQQLPGWVFESSQGLYVGAGLDTAAGM